MIAVIVTSYHDRVNVLQVAGVPISSPFDRVEWFTLLAESGIEPLVVSAQGEGSAAAMMLTRANGRLESLRNWYSFTWRPMVRAEPGGDGLLAALARELRTRTHRVTLWPVPDEDSSATRLERAFRAAGWQVSCEQCDHNHVLEVGGRSFAEYWAARPGQMRTTLKRKAAKVSVDILTRFDAAAWDAYETIYRASWKPEEGDPALLRRFAEQEGSAGRIRLGIARHEGLPVAAQFWTVEAGTAFIHKLAHLEQYKALSAGTTLSAALFEHAIDRDKVALIDFGTGNDPYKRDWMELDRARFLIDCLDPRQPRSWPALARRGLARVAPGALRG